MLRPRFFLLLLAASQLRGYQLPDATDRIPVFSDQLNEAPGSANFTFNATHFAGMQKIDKARIDAYRQINPGFIAVQYHKSYGVDLQQNITSATAPYWNNDCDTFYAWVGRNPGYGARESYYLHYTATADSAHRIRHFWNNVNEYFLADLRHAGWRAYVAQETVRRCQTMGFDGAFFDATYFPSYGYDPENWCDSAPYNAASIVAFGPAWNADFAMPYWGSVRRYYHSQGRDYLCIVNCDQMVTGWYSDDYLDSADGAMAEGFFTYGGTLTGADWQLSASRIIRYLTSRDKILIAQCSPAANDLSQRRWCIGNYLLLKNRYSYYNIASGSSTAWWPEYEIDLDSFMAPPTALSALLVSGKTALYRREYKGGIVLVNPGSVSETFALTGSYRPVAFSGGGAVSNGVTPTMNVTPGTAISGTLSVAAGEVAILQKTAAAVPRAQPSGWRTAGQTGARAVYDIRGARVPANSEPERYGIYLRIDERGTRLMPAEIRREYE